MEFLKKLIGLTQGVRKFVVMLLIFSVGVYFRLKDYVNGVEFVELIKVTAVAFFGANLMEHVKSTVLEYVKEKVKK